MLVDASVARSFAVVGWTRHLLQGTGGTILVADTVHGAYQDDPSELRRIRNALQRQAEDAGLGSGRAGRALAAVRGLDQLPALAPNERTVLTLNVDTYRWRRVLGPPRLSIADLGLTFGSTTARGTCIGFKEPVRGLDPLGLVRHPSLTVTVEHPDQLSERFRQLGAAGHSTPDAAEGSASSSVRQRLTQGAVAAGWR